MRLIGLPALLAVILTPGTFAQSYTISTFAGGGLPAVNIAGTSESISPGPVATDSAGNVFFSNRYQVLRLDAKTGILTLVAGNGTAGFSGDGGPAVYAELTGVTGLAVDSAGNLYVCDSGNNRIRKVANGIMTTVAGGGSSVGDNVPAVSAQLVQPGGIAVDAAGKLYIADGTDRIRIVANGVITTVAGNGTVGFSGDNGPATSAELSGPSGLAVDAAGNLYFVDSTNYRIGKVSNGVITTVAGNGTNGSNGNNGSATSAALVPSSLAVDSTGNIFVAEFLNRDVREVSNGVITAFAGGGSTGLGDGGPAASAQLASPYGVATDSVGNLYIADYDRIRKVTAGFIYTIAGNGTLSFGGDNGPAASAQLSIPEGVVTDSAGDIYIADSGNYRVRKVSKGVISTVAGNGIPGFSGDGGPATNATLSFPTGLAIDSVGNLYIADETNFVIRKVSKGVITTVAGNETYGFSGDGGPATSAQLFRPNGVAVDAAGNLYIADTSNDRIRKVSNGVITTVAGTGKAGFSGDNGPAINAQLNNPAGVAVDVEGNLYIADTDNSRIRKVSNGVITTVAGDGIGGFSGDNGSAASAELSYPVDVSVDSTGNLYIADYFNARIRMVSNGVITTIAGNGRGGFSGDNGPATSAEFYEIYGVAVDSTGNVYVADSQNNRIRLLTPYGFGGSLQTLFSVNNAASNNYGAVSPGEIVTITGFGIGPSQLVSAQLGSDGFYDPTLANTSVQFNGIPAPMIYSWTNQVAAIVPYWVVGSTALVTVTYQGQTAIGLSIPVASASPGLFTLDSTGQGQAAAIDQNGSYNSASAPAPIGSIIALYATGAGQTSPAGIDGKPAAAPYPAPNLPVTVTIGGVTLSAPQVAYAGAAPGEVAGLLQINVTIPAGITPGPAVPVAVNVGGIASQTGVTIAVSED